MSTFLVLAFDHETGAQRMIGYVQSWQRQQLLTISDAATVVRQANGKIKVKQANSLVGAGTCGGAFWGLLVALLFWPTWRGFAVSAPPDKSVSNIGLADDFIEAVNHSIRPGCSALFLLVAYMKEEMLPISSDEAFQLLQAHLSLEDEARLCDVFGVAEPF